MPAGIDQLQAPLHIFEADAAVGFVFFYVDAVIGGVLNKK